MKNFKLFGIIMMLIMGMSFSSCKDDDDPESEGTSSESINKNLEGEWFLVKFTNEYSSSTSGIDIENITWDYNNQTKNGISDQGESCEPIKYIFTKVSNNIFDMSYSEYEESYWTTDEPKRYNLNGNILYERSYNDGDCTCTDKMYISELTNKRLVLIGEYYETSQNNATIQEKRTFIFQRNK